MSLKDKISFIGAVIIILIIASFLGIYSFLEKQPSIFISKNAILQQLKVLPDEFKNMKYLTNKRYDDLEKKLKQVVAMVNDTTDYVEMTKETEYGKRVKVTEDQAKESKSQDNKDDLLTQLLLPHVLKDHKVLQPAIKVSRRKLKRPMILGIPSVKRHIENYLIHTLTSIFSHINEEEAKYVSVILMIADPHDLQYVKKTAKSVEKLFRRELNQGLLEIIAPPVDFYPDLSHLILTFGDDYQQVYWRSKQNLDYAYLMMYAKERGYGYYVQLEDDIVSKPNFVTTMRNVAEARRFKNQNWFMIGFSKLGFIGKLFKVEDLPILVEFFLTFYGDKPVDWLLEDIMSTKVCSPEYSKIKCNEAKKGIQIQHTPSLFQHIGIHSSLKGKVQKLKDTSYDEYQHEYHIFDFDKNS